MNFLDGEEDGVVAFAVGSWMEEEVKEVKEVEEEVVVVDGSDSGWGRSDLR